MVPLTKRKDLKFVPGKGFVSIKPKPTSSSSSSSSRAPTKIEATLDSSGVETIKTTTPDGKVTTTVSKPKSSSSRSRSRKTPTPTGPGELRARVVEESTGKVIDEGQFQLDRAFEARKAATEKKARIAGTQTPPRPTNFQQILDNRLQTQIPTRKLETLTPSKTDSIYKGLTLAEKARLAESRIRNTRRDVVTPGVVKDASVLVGAGLASGTIGLIEIITSPIQSVVGLARAAAAPKETLNLIQDDIRKSPITFVFETVGSFGAGSMISKPIRAIVRKTKKIEVFSKDEIASINNKLEELSKQKQTREVKQDIKILETNKKIIQNDLKSLTTATTNLEKTFKPIVKDVVKVNTKAKAKVLDTKIKKEILKIKKIDKNINNIQIAIKKTKKVKTKPAQTLPKNEDKLIQLIKDSQSNPTELKRLRNKIKQDLGKTFKIQGKDIIFKRSVDLRKGVKKQPKQFKITERNKIIKLSDNLKNKVITQLDRAAAFDREIIQGKKISSLTKTDIKNLLDKPKGKELLRDRIKTIEKQILQNKNLIEEIKIKAKDFPKATRNKLAQSINQLIKINKSLDLKKDRLIKGLKEKTPLNEKQFERRAKLFEEKQIKTPAKVESISSSPNSLTIKTSFGDVVFELNLPRQSLRSSKRGSMQIPFKISFNKSTKSKYGNKAINKYQDELKKAANTNQGFRKAIDTKRDLLQRERKIIQLSKRKGLNDQTKKKLNQAKKSLKELEKATDKAISLAWIKLIGKINKRDVKQAQDVIKVLDRVQDRANKIFQDLEFKTPSKPIRPTKPKTPGKPGTKTSIVRTTTPTRTTITPKTRLTPKALVIPRKIKTKPPVKPIILPKIQISKQKRVVRSEPLGQIDYVITNPKTKKRDVIKVRTNLPFTEAKALGKQVVDNTILASFSVKPYGSKKKRLTLEKVDLTKFTKRKGKDTKVQTLVERKKYRLDTKGETKQISQARIRQLTIDRAKQLRELLNKLEKK